MKVLFISNHHEGPNGWSLQAQNHILALDKAGVDIVPRRLNITGQINPNINPRILELEKNNDENSDIILLNTLPSMYEKSSRKTVGFYVCETTFASMGWSSRINLLDAAVNCCYENKKMSIDSGVKIPIHIVPQAIDVDIYKNPLPPHMIRENNKDKFLFLVCAEWTQRKNIEAVIKAFHIEFCPNEPVELIIKTTPVGFSNPQEEISAKMNVVKNNLRIYRSIDRYKRENVICGYLSENDMASLIQSVDCYVSSSRAEAFNLSLAQSMAAGKICIAPNTGGMYYINDKNGYVVQTTEQPCYGANDTLEGLYTGNESWKDVNIYSLMKCMRDAYEKKTLNLKKIQQARKDVEAFNFHNIGTLYKQVLEKIL